MQNEFFYPIKNRFTIFSEIFHWYHYDEYKYKTINNDWKRTESYNERCKLRFK